MKLKTVAIDAFANYLLSGQAWTQIQSLVNIVESPEKPGTQKRFECVKMLEKAGIDLASWLINLGIELAVAKLRANAER